MAHVANSGIQGWSVDNLYPMSIVVYDDGKNLSYQAQNLATGQVVGDRQDSYTNAQDQLGKHVAQTMVQSGQAVFSNLYFAVQSDPSRGLPDQHKVIDCRTGRNVQFHTKQEAIIGACSLSIRDGMWK